MAQGAADAAGSPDAPWFVAALEASSDVVVVIDTMATVRWANPAMTRVLGRRPQDVVGTSLADYVHPDDMARAVEVIGLSVDGKFDATPITPARS